jgi:hypothetical protein
MIVIPNNTMSSFDDNYMLQQKSCGELLKDSFDPPSNQSFDSPSNQSFDHPSNQSSVRGDRRHGSRPQRTCINKYCTNISQWDILHRKSDSRWGEHYCSHDCMISGSGYVTKKCRGCLEMISIRGRLQYCNRQCMIDHRETLKYL